MPVLALRSDRLAIIAIELLGDYAARVGLAGAIPVAVTIEIIALIVWAVSRLLQAVGRLVLPEKHNRSECQRVSVRSKVRGAVNSSRS